MQKLQFNNPYQGSLGFALATKKPSLTIPDQTLTIQQILARYARGLPLDGARVPEYHGEEEVMDSSEWKRLDLSEQQDWIKTNRDHILNLQNELKTKQEEKNILKKPSPPGNEGNEAAAQPPK